MRDELAAVEKTLGMPEPDPAQILAALTNLRDLRDQLDRAELQLITAAREADVGWARIATALRLASRQAAEQRRLRLAGPTGQTPGSGSRDPGAARAARQRQQLGDAAAGEPIRALRAVTLVTCRLLDADPFWPDRHSRAALARATLDLAAGAEPGALFALVTAALGDFDAVGAPVWPGPVATAVGNLRAALTAATPRLQS